MADINDLYYEIKSLKDKIQNIDRNTQKVENNTDDEILYMKRKIDEIDQNVKRLIANQSQS